MSDAGRLLGWFESGELLRPDATLPNLVDLTLALAQLCGADVAPLTENASRIAAAIGASDHYVLVLLDGFGMHLVDALRPDDPLRASLAMELRTVFPTSTAPALTSLASGLWPADHAVPGWWTHLPDAGLTATILPFAERFTERSLADFGVAASMAFPAPVLPARFRRRCHWVSPSTISGSVYSRYSSADASRRGYDSLADAVRSIADNIEHAEAPTYTYLYVPYIDTAEHEHGPHTRPVSRAVDHARARIKTLVELLQGRARVVITADHGQIEVPPERRVILDRRDPLMSLLRQPPSCEPRASAFHVEGGAEDRFAALFHERYGARFALLTTDEVDELRLLGPAPLGRETRRRIGDFLAIPHEVDVILYEPADTLRAMRGFHGGLLPDEARIPLILT
jgi:hypothetical protein